MNLQVVAKILFHLAPVIPFGFGKAYLGVACVLLVLLPYIKTFKLTATLEDLAAQKREPSDRELQKLIVLRRRWKSLTFLR